MFWFIIANRRKRRTHKIHDFFHVSGFAEQRKTHGLGKPNTVRFCIFQDCFWSLEGGRFHELIRLAATRNLSVLYSLSIASYALPCCVSMRSEIADREKSMEQIFLFHALFACLVLALRWYPSVTMHLTKLEIVCHKELRENNQPFLENEIQTSKWFCHDYSAEPHSDR